MKKIDYSYLVNLVETKKLKTYSEVVRSLLYSFGFVDLEIHDLISRLICDGFIVY